MSRVHSDYEPRVHSSREKLKNDHALMELLSPTGSPLLLECFLVEWMSRMPYLTAPNADWIRRAGRRCIEQGWKRVGHAMLAHADCEDGTLDLTSRNLRAIVRAMNTRYGIRIDSDVLLTNPPTVTMRAYRILHEEVIAADISVGAIAIAYEMERARSLFELMVLVEVQRSLGPEIALSLSALRKRAPVAVERTVFFERALAEILEQNPECYEQLAEIGSGALDIYRHFLRECVDAAKERARSMPVPSSRRPAPSSSAQI